MFDPNDLDDDDDEDDDDVENADDVKVNFVNLRKSE